MVSKKMSRSAEFYPIDLKERTENGIPTSGPKSLDTLKSQVEEVKSVMSENVNKINERCERLESILQRSNDLEEGCALFHERSGKLQRQMRWKRLKWNLMVGGVIGGILAILLIICLLEAGVFSHRDNTQPQLSIPPKPTNTENM